MAILKQKSNVTYYQGWYGLCKDGDVPCESFPLISGSAYIHDSIDKIYEISDNSEGEIAYDGTLTFSGAIATLALKELECGKCYRIKMKTGNGELNIPDFTYANAGSDDQQDINNRITSDCSSGGGQTDFVFNVATAVSDEIDEGYKFYNDWHHLTTHTPKTAQEHESIITSATGVQSVAITASQANKLEYSTGGAWQTITPADSTISSDFTSLKLRVKLGLENGPDHNTTVSLVATPDNNLYQNQSKSFVFNITINNVSMSISKTINEIIEEGSTGDVHTAVLTWENLDEIDITGSPAGYVMSVDGGQTWEVDPWIQLGVSTSPVSPLTVQIKLDGNMPSSPVNTNFEFTGERRNQGDPIELANAVTASATVAPRPQITALSANILSGTVADPTGSIEVSLSVEDETNYGGHHWHYEIEDADGSIVVSEKMVNAGSGGFGGTSLSLADFSTPGTYTLTAWIVTQGHQKIAGSLDKTANFVIAANDATLSVNKPAISEILDIDETQVTHTITVTSNNLTNLTLSPVSLNNWTYTQLSGNTFTVSLKDSVKNTDLGYNISMPGPVDLARETLTLTGDVGLGDSSGDSTKSAAITLDAKLVDNSEFSITGANLNVTDNRDFGESAQEFGPYTITYDAINLSVNSLSDWEIEFNDSGTWTSTWSYSNHPASGSTFKVRNKTTSVGSYNETLTLTPTPAETDHDVSDDPSPVTLTLNCTINALQATLTNPGTQTLSSVVSGVSPTGKTFTTAGANIQNITIAEVSSGWSVTPANPTDGALVSISYTGDEVSVGTKTGTFKISAEAVTGASFGTGASASPSFHVVDLSLVVSPKLAEVDTSPSSITLNPITSGGSSNVAYMNVAGVNIDDIVLTTIPAGFVVRNGATTLSNGASGLDGEQLTISLADTTTPGTRNGTIVLTGTASANSAFSGGVDTKNVSVSGVVQGLATALSISPSSVTDNVDENGSVSAHEITLTQSNLESVSVSGGNASKYQVSSSENGTYGNSASIDVSDSSFWVKLMDTSSAGTISTNFTISGTKSSVGASNPSNVTLSCTATVTAIVVATLTVSPTSVTDTVDKDGSVSAHQITLSQSNLSSVAITGGNASKYQVSTTESGSYANSLTLTSSASVFWVKLMDTSATGSISTTITIHGDVYGGADPSDKTVSCTATVNEVASGPEKLWVGFQDGGNTTYTNWYELNTINTEAAEVKNMANQKILDWNAMVASGTMPPGVEQVSDNFTFDSAKHSAAHPTAGTFSVFGGNIPGTPTQFQSYFSTTTEYLAGLEGASVTKVETVGWVTTITWDVSFTFALNYTKFTIADSDSAYSTELSSLMASGGSDVGYLQGVMITASPDRPSVAPISLNATQQGKTYNSDLLNVFCNGCPPESGGEGVLLKIVQVVGAGTDTKSYNATSCSHGGMTSGSWSGSNLYYAGSASASQGSVARQSPESSPIVINEMYFELAAAATKLKLTSGKLPDCA